MGTGRPCGCRNFGEGVALSRRCRVEGGVFARGDPTEDGGHRPSQQICDGIFDGEKIFGRVTGNNCVSWTPQLHDWYETIKLNYGFDFTDPAKSIREYPNAWAPDKPVPDTWQKVDDVI